MNLEMLERAGGLYQIKERYEKNIKRSVTEANISLKINNLLTTLKITNLINILTNGSYNGIVSFNYYSKKAIQDKLNIRMLEYLERTPDNLVSVFPS